jgi:hypothetical protein
MVFTNPFNAERKVYFQGEMYGDSAEYDLSLEDRTILDFKGARASEYPPQVIWHGENIVEIPSYHTYLSSYSQFYDFRDDEETYENYYDDVLYVDTDKNIIIVGEYKEASTKDIFTEIDVYDIDLKTKRGERKPNEIFYFENAKQVVSVKIKNNALIVYKDLMKIDSDLSVYDKNAVIKTVEYDYP